MYSWFITTSCYRPGRKYLNSLGGLAAELERYVSKRNTMRIKYITTDLNLKSKEDLSQLAANLCHDESPHLNEWVNNTYELRLGGIGIENSPANDIELFCKRIESLTVETKKLWNNCESRILDIAFEGGDNPNNLTSLLPEELILRLGKLKLGIEITIYHTGLYPHLE